MQSLRKRHAIAAETPCNRCPTAIQSLRTRQPITLQSSLANTIQLLCNRCANAHSPYRISYPNLIFPLPSSPHHRPTIKQPNYSKININDKNDNGVIGEQPGEMLIPAGTVENSTPVKDDYLGKFTVQVKLLCWKRLLEFQAAPSEPLKMCIALLFFALVILLNKNILSGLPPCVLEFFLVPIAFWPFVQRMVVQITAEKSNRLEEAMKSMGLYQSAYYLSYFLTDGVILGFALSFLCSIMTGKCD
jgi:hypothetical protein